MITADDLRRFLCDRELELRVRATRDRCEASLWSLGLPAKLCGAGRGPGFLSALEAAVADLKRGEKSAPPRSPRDHHQDAQDARRLREAVAFHLDTCERCREDPFALCAVGEPLLEAAHAASPRTTLFELRGRR